MKLDSVSIQTWGTTITINLVGIGKVQLNDVINKPELAELREIFLSIAKRVLNPQIVAAALNPDNILEHERGE